MFLCFLAQGVLALVSGDFPGWLRRRSPFGDLGDGEVLPKASKLPS